MKPYWRDARWPATASRRMTQHYPVQVWAQYRRGRLRPDTADALTAHLEECRECSNLTEKWVAVDHYFGRPVPAMFCSTVVEIEQMLRSEWLPLFRSLLDRPPREIHIAGTTDAEPVVYRALSLSKARLGSRFQRLPLRVTSLDDCEQPDLVVHGTTRRQAQWAELREEIRRLILEPESGVQSAAILAACDIAVPSSRFQHEPPLAFSPLVDDAGEPLPLWSIPGQWTAAQVLTQIALETPKSIRQAVRIEAQQYPGDSRLGKILEITA